VWFICTEHNSAALVPCLPHTPVMTGSTVVIALVPCLPHAPVMTGSTVVRRSINWLHVSSDKSASRHCNFSYLFSFIVLTSILVAVLNMIYLFIRC